MSQTELPTLRGVLRHGIYLQEKKLLEEGVDRRNYSIKQLAKDVRVEVVSCWQRANVQFRPPVTITDVSIEVPGELDCSAELGLEQRGHGEGGGQE